MTDVHENLTLEQRVSNIERILHLLAPQIQTLAEAQKLQVKELDVHARYEQAKSENRTIHGVPSEVVAIFAHYHHKKSVPMKAIGLAKLVSMGKSYGLGSWSLQFMGDYIKVHNLEDIYENASEMPDLIQKYPAMRILNENFKIGVTP